LICLKASATTDGLGSDVEGISCGNLAYTSSVWMSTPSRYSAFP